MKKLITTAFVCVSLQAGAQQLPQLGKSDLNDVIGALTLEEKIDLLVGAEKEDNLSSATIGKTMLFVPGAAGTTGVIERLGIPATVFADGPAGVRIDATREKCDRTFHATHFPVETLLSSSWNTDLLYKVGETMGNEALEYGVDVLLAPGVNIQRNPLGGRNFEYYSEDPLLSGKMGAAMVRGVQSRGVGTSLKHLAANNQEINRTGVDARISERALREIYLKPFEIVVKESDPWTVMSSYNMLNGSYTAESYKLLTSILRNEWGYHGLVVSDWYGGKNAVRMVKAGNDVIMPGTTWQRIQLKQAIENGTLSMEEIDRNVMRVLQFIMRTPRFKHYAYTDNPDLKAHAAVAREAATEGMVLLENRNNTLPFDASVKKVAVFGTTSYDFIAGGSGSGNVNHAYVVSLIEGLKNAGLQPERSLVELYESHLRKETPLIPETAWFLPKGRVGETDVDERVITRSAQTQDMALITVGRFSGEFLDRKLSGGFTLTERERSLIENVSKAFHGQGKKVVVILNVCGPIETTSWINKADAVLVAWMAGQEGGNAVMDILNGKVTPSGKLPMTFPVNYEDDPTAENFPNTDFFSASDAEEMMISVTDNKATCAMRKDIDYSDYKESIFVGYRYFDSQKVPVSYPFGYGLSYTKFAYLQPSLFEEKDGVSVSVTIKNTGQKMGKEVVQVYVSAPGKDLPKPVKELKGFTKTALLLPGEEKRITIFIPTKSLSSYDMATARWKLEEGEYMFHISVSSTDVKYSLPLSIH